MVDRRRSRTFSAATLCGPAQVAAWQQVESLEERTLLSNLAITEAFFVDGNNVQIANPVLGERLEIRNRYSTTGLPSSAAYAIRVSVDGIATDRNALTFGAGFGAGTWFADVLHGFAEPGTHTVQVILDPLNQVAEDNENDNTFSFSMTPVTATNLPQKLQSFVFGTAGVNWRITNFADLDVRPGTLRDFNGGEFTYDTDSFGHDAIDLTPGPFSRTDAGARVFAAADGVVAFINDGAFDRNTAFGTSVPPVNYVTISHGNGWATEYLHLRRDSVSVKVGDAVMAGDFLGWMGSSGQSTGAHVHFSVTYNNHSVETMLDQSTYWVTPPAYPADYRHVLGSGFSTQAPTSSEWDEQPSDIRTFVRGGSVYFWIMAGAMMPGDIRTVRFFRPDGTVFFERDYNSSSVFYRISNWNYLINLPANAPLGTWTAAWLQNGIELARQSFSVATTGVPELRVEQATNLILDQRFTPIDFGTSPVSGTSPTQSFTITNQGSAPLSLGTISCRPGIRLRRFRRPSLRQGKRRLCQFAC